MEENGNPFNDDSRDLYNIDTKDVAGDGVIDTVRHIEQLGQQQYHEFVKQCFLEKGKSIFFPITRNKLQLFSTPQKRKSLRFDIDVITKD